MKIRKTDSEKKTSPKQSTTAFPFIIAAIVILIVIFFLFWQQRNDKTNFDGQVANKKKEVSEITVTEPPVPTSTHNVKASNSNISESPPSIISQDQSQNQNTSQPTERTTPENNNGYIATNQVQEPAIKGNENTTTENLSSLNSNTYLFNSCTQSADIINQFYAHLDTQEYIKQYGLKVKSEEYFSILIQRLLDNPPVVSGEMNDLFTILQNTAHFFRIIGKSNILLLKGILDREKDQFENVLDHFYSLINIPNCPEQSFNLKITKSSLTDYAGFFLNTMGGRLYLFRRDSVSRMVVSYYAILLIDQANKEARNQHGIEIKIAIDQLINEIESSQNQLKLKDKYLDNLYNLKEQYQ